MSSTNFQQWNPAQANQETDAAYTADPSRSGGAASNAIFPSPLANKLFYQLSTFVTAFCEMLVAKGISTSDASISALEAALAAVLTTADLPIPIPVVDGGTGATTFDLANLPHVVAKIDVLGATSTVTPGTTLYAVPATGNYMVTIQAFLHSPSMSSSIISSVAFTSHGASNWGTAQVAITTAGDGQQSGVGIALPDSSTNLTYEALFTSGGAGDNYDLHIRVIKIP